VSLAVTAVDAIVGDLRIPDSVEAQPRPSMAEASSRQLEPILEDDAPEKPPSAKTLKPKPATRQAGLRKPQANAACEQLPKDASIEAPDGKAMKGSQRKPCAKPAAAGEAVKKGSQPGSRKRKAAAVDKEEDGSKASAGAAGAPERAARPARKRAAKSPPLAETGGATTAPQSGGPTLSQPEAGPPRQSGTSRPKTAAAKQDSAPEVAELASQPEVVPQRAKRAGPAPNMGATDWDDPAPGSPANSGDSSQEAGTTAAGVADLSEAGAGAGSAPADGAASEGAGEGPRRPAPSGPGTSGGAPTATVRIVLRLFAWRSSCGTGAGQRVWCLDTP
jgi:hypothetical protein